MSLPPPGPSIIRFPIPKAKTQYGFMIFANSGTTGPTVNTFLNTTGKPNPTWARVDVGHWAADTEFPVLIKGYGPAPHQNGRVGGLPAITNSNHDGPNQAIPILAQSETGAGHTLVGYIIAAWWANGGYTGTVSLWIKITDPSGNLTDGIHINPMEFILDLYNPDIFQPLQLL